MAKKPTVADLMDEIQALKREIAELKARPAQQVHYHYPSQPQYYTLPLTAPAGDPWPSGTIICGAGASPAG
jgi:hypothetical protein